MLSAVAVYNGYPFFFFDTHAYYTTGEKAAGFILKVACRGSSWCQPATAEAPRPDDLAGSRDAAAETERHSKTIHTGRSVYYGILVYLGDRLAGVWLVVAAQAITASWFLHLLYRRLVPEPSALGFLGLIAALTALSSLPFFVGYLMPDLFAGLYIAALALLIAVPDRLTRPEFAAVWILLAASLLFHRSHLLGAALLLGLIVCFLLAFDRIRLRGAGSALFLVGAAVAVGGTGFLLFDFAASKITGQRATPPPFLLARVIEDGPGTGYLRSVCPQRSYAVCRFVDRMPMPVTDFLWSADPAKGVWYVATPPERVQIVNEQFEIVLNSFLDAPWQQITATTKNFMQQLVNFSVMEFAVPGELRSFMGKSFGGYHAEHFLRSRIARGDFDLVGWSIIHYLAAAGSLLLLLVRYRRLDRSTRLMLSMVLCGIVLNALVTGTLSRPDHRFQARVIWLLPAFAVLVELSRRAEPARRTAAAARADPPVGETGTRPDLEPGPGRW